MSLPALRSSVGSLDFREIDYDTPISIACSGGEITMSVQTVLDWVCPGAPPPDALKFLVVCRNLGLNPLIGEAFLLPMGKKEEKYQVVFPKAAYLKKAQENPAYDGHESGITVWFNGEFHDEEGTIRPPVEGVKVVGGWARVWRKGVIRSVYKRVSFDEYGKNNHIWTQNPATMIAKVALVAALREAFGLSGYDESECERDLPREVAPILTTTEMAARIAIDAPQPPRDDAIDVQITSYRDDDPIDYVRPDLIESIDRLTREAGMTADDVDAMLARRYVKDIGRLTVIQAEEIVARLEGMASMDQAAKVFGGDPEAEKSGGSSS